MKLMRRARQTLASVLRFMIQGLFNCAEAATRMVSGSRTTSVALFSATVMSVYLLPTLGAGLSDGDVALAQIRGFADYENINWYTALARVQHQLNLEQGGWFPLRGFPLLLWIFAPSSTAAHLLQLLIVSVDVAVFVALIALLSRSLRLAALAGLSVPLCLQLRKPHDEVLGATLQLPLVLGAMFGSYLLFASYIDRPRWRKLLYCILLEVLSCAMHEAAYILTLGFLVICVIRRARISVVSAMLFVLPALAAMIVATKSSIPISLFWLTHITPFDMHRTTADLVAAIPTSYRAFGNVLRDGFPDGLTDSRFDSIPPASISGLTVCVAVGAAMLALLRRKTRSQWAGDVRTAPLAVLASLLLCAGAVPHDPRAWSAGIPWGEGDLTIYLSCFGAALLIALALHALSRRGKSELLAALAPPIVALAASLILYGNDRINERVVSLDRDRYDTWDLIETAGHAGLFAPVPTNSLLVFDGEPTPLTGQKSGGFRNLKYLIFQSTATRYRVAPYRSIFPGGDLCLRAVEPMRSCVPTQNVWILKCERRGPMQGGLQLTHWAETSDRRILIDRANGFRTFQSRGERDAYASSMALPSRGLEDVRVSRSPRGVTVQSRRACGPVAEDRAFEQDLPTIRYGLGVVAPALNFNYQFSANPGLALYGDGSQPWRYGLSRSQLVVEPDRCGPASLRISATIFAPRPGLARIYLGGRPYGPSLIVGEDGTEFGVPIYAATSRPISILIESKAGAAPEDKAMPLFDRRRFPPPSVIIDSPTVTIESVGRAND